MHKIIRALCLFASEESSSHVERLHRLAEGLKRNNFEVQTLRLCLKTLPKRQYSEKELMVGLGKFSFKELESVLPRFLAIDNSALSVDLTHEMIEKEHVQQLFDILRYNPKKSFLFTYAFNLPPSSPFFPTASYAQDGFSLGLQLTSLSEECYSLESWLERIETTLIELANIFRNEEDFLGIDSSIAPLYTGPGSLLFFLKQLGMNFSHSVTTDTYLRITKFIRQHNPCPVGLCGLMFPCLEDFELAEEYEKGRFDIERNLFLSLHCGLGIDTYPIAMDENPERVLEILRLVQGLSNRYQKPLSVRFVSDGKAKIGERSQFHNPFLKDVTIRSFEN